ncbi:MAG: ATP--guanido phosphotransferase [Clostridia bacterium]|nr:ATP--guanido phosphotransferase [Clostridia bacterium]
MDVLESFESVVASTRMRLARNFADYPFPNILLRDAHAEEQADEMVSILTTELNRLDIFRLYEMKSVSEETAALLQEKNLISRDLIANNRISAALVSEDEHISVMINEEDHLRIQYFMKGLDLNKAFERVSGIDDMISATIPFAYDSELGYLTACPTNLGTGLRASVMLFLPALSRRGLMKKTAPQLSHGGLTVRGASGEGSGTEGDFFQVSNEKTLGLAEEDILDLVERAVETLTELEIRERMCMKAEGGLSLLDEIGRSYGILYGCKKITATELASRVADIKLGLALGYIEGEKDGEKLIGELDDFMVKMRPANLKKLSGIKPDGEERDAYRARAAAEMLKEMKLYL